jgi:MoaA/NifB/PqqE/SkfB family radical SAM enzyme
MMEERYETYPAKEDFYRMPWSKNDNPIGWLEITDTCNLYCKGCYRQRLTGHKSLAKIKQEIVMFKKWRNCDNISIAGGEPMTHPDIEEIVSFIHKNKMKPIILTNAALLTLEKLKALKKAGLAGLTIHIDSFQNRPGWEGKTEEELNELRMHYAEMAYKAGKIFCSFNSTIYYENFKSIPVILKWANQHLDKVHSVIFITYRGVPITDDLEYLSGDQKISVKNELSYIEDDLSKIDITSVNVYNILKETLPEYDASAYLGGTATHEAYKWLLGVLVGVKNKPLGNFGKKGMELAQAGHHVFLGTYQAYLTSNKIGRRAFLLSLFDKKIWRTFKRYLANPFNIFKPVYAQAVSIIQAPDLTCSQQEDMCDSCPDMTWYDGKLINSCRMDEYRKFGGLIHMTKKAKKIEDGADKVLQPS